MQKNNKKRNRRASNLVMLCAFTAIILTVSTYAWFVGLQTVRVNTFDVEIKAADSLLLSIDGENWDNVVTINKDNYATAYDGNTNSWGGEGLVPISTVGDMNNVASRMVLYEKSSLTMATGGYRVMSHQINNLEAAEKDGYVAFDLFIKNYTGSKYYVDLNEAQEEAIYLTTESEVTVGSDGTPGTGIENSVRVAFAQIGRVIGTNTDAGVITGITCSDSASSVEKTNPNYVTGICRDAQIWEPNDRAHEQNAINYYNTACLARTAKDVFTPLTEEQKIAKETNCGQLVDGTYYNTYAFSGAILETDAVNSYDGTEYNTYFPTEEEDSIYTDYATYKAAEDKTDYKVVQYDYFTDEEKMKEGVDRPVFMTLAPNSITKVRIYIYLEGQDVDNYDFAAAGKQIAVRFGFTKERFTEADVNYTGPSLDGSVCDLSGVADIDEPKCTGAGGQWDNADSVCTGYGKKFCEAVGGTYTAGPRTIGVCTGGTVPTTEEDCKTNNGMWTGTNCNVSEKLACETIGGAWEQYE